MNGFLVAAAVVAVIVGAAHSVIGEVLIFRRLRQGTLVPSSGAPPLRERHIRILWATWHIATVLCWGFAAILVDFATVEIAAIAAFFASSILVLVGTKGRHPGWVGLLAVAVLVSLAVVSGVGR